jgi:hypothetical protein
MYFNPPAAAAAAACSATIMSRETKTKPQANPIAKLFLGQMTKAVTRLSRAVTKDSTIGTSQKKEKVVYAMPRG